MTQCSARPDRLRDEVTRLSARLESDEPDGEVDTPSRPGPLGSRTARLAQREAQLLVATARKEASGEVVRTARLQAARDQEVADRLIGTRLAELAQQYEPALDAAPARDLTAGRSSGRRGTTRRRRSVRDGRCSALRLSGTSR